MQPDAQKLLDLTAIVGYSLSSTLKLDEKVQWVSARRWRHEGYDDTVTTWRVHVTSTDRRITGADCEHVIVRLARWRHFGDVRHGRAGFVKFAPFSIIYVIIIIIIISSSSSSSSSNSSSGGAIRRCIVANYQLNALSWQRRQLPRVRRAFFIPTSGLFSISGGQQTGSCRRCGNVVYDLTVFQRRLQCCDQTRKP